MSTKYCSEILSAEVRYKLPVIGDSFAAKTCVALEFDNNAAVFSDSDCYKRCPAAVCQAAGHWRQLRRQHLHRIRPDVDQPRGSTRAAAAAACTEGDSHLKSPNLLGVVAAAAVKIVTVDANSIAQLFCQCVTIVLETPHVLHMSASVRL